MKRVWKFVLICLSVLLLLAILCHGCVDAFNVDWYTTTDISDYGQFEGNHQNEPVREFMMSYFPKNIEHCFEDIVYQYKACDWCAYGCEMYLEFTISNPDEFKSYVDELTAGMTKQIFPYDDRYYDYIVYNHLFVEQNSESDLNNPRHFFRNGARMGRILVCEEEQRIICEGILVSGCCGGYAQDYDFYERFEIDPQEYSDRFCNETEFE